MSDMFHTGLLGYGFRRDRTQGIDLMLIDNLCVKLSLFDIERQFVTICTYNLYIPHISISN